MASASLAQPTWLAQPARLSLLGLLSLDPGPPRLSQSLPDGSHGRAGQHHGRVALAHQLNLMKRREGLMHKKIKIIQLNLKKRGGGLMYKKLYIIQLNLQKRGGGLM